MFAASSPPRHLKLVQCLAKNVLYPLPVFLVIPPFPLAVHFTFCACYLPFVIAIEISASFVATPSGIGGRPLYHSVLPCLLFSFIPLDCTYRVGLYLSVVERLAVVLFGFFLAFLRSLQSSSTLRIVTLTKVFSLPLRHFIGLKCTMYTNTNVLRLVLLIQRRYDTMIDTGRFF
ncbi:hypothetical protein BDM02DRAFT_1507595 [Thelephora ganbajun]|uniref:Uncharacterized protein n=1 Tax=Thelephora ganbajun TaxID=370292 RepID=A0ACB6Z1G5_THEGA|nr:hypothetical protein BDM02DRAFT_1507595 [Thelephora ganbajun]